MTATDERAEVSGGLVRYVPGARLVRTYQRSWLRPDLVAGLVLATLLVPQGMAYAELAGLPPSPGSTRPSRASSATRSWARHESSCWVPDSSISPLIFAAIAPLLAGDRDPGARDRARRDARHCSSGSSRSASGSGELGFVADLLSKEVKIGYMNGLAVTIVVGQLPKLFGFSTDAAGFLTSSGPRSTASDRRVRRR